LLLTRWYPIRRALTKRAPETPIHLIWSIRPVQRADPRL